MAYFKGTIRNYHLLEVKEI